MRFLYAVNKIDTESKPHVKFILNEIIRSYHIPTEIELYGRKNRHH